MFQSTPPSREATRYRVSSFADKMFQSTPPSREATVVKFVWSNFGTVSIHAPLTGGDTRRLPVIDIERQFQSTPPSREATTRWHGQLRLHREFQSTPPSREATVDRWPPPGRAHVSIHAPLTGGDFTSIFFAKNPNEFQSTPPSREATVTPTRTSQTFFSFNPRPPHGRRHNPLD